MDGWKTLPGREIRQHSGLQDPFGNLYRPTVDAFVQFCERMYAVALEGAEANG